jgi:hypothetical protein
MRLTTGADMKQRWRHPTPGNHASLPGEMLRFVDLKLRLHRNYSIKLMLAWEMCCRSTLSPPVLL